MYRQELKHKLRFEVINDLPKITIGIRFNDLFTQDTYVLVSESVKYFDKNKIPFTFIKNDKKIASFCLTNFDGLSFLNESFSEIEDYDFKLLFKDDIKLEISNDIKENVEEFERQIILNEVSLNGEISRMKELSGIKRKQFL